MNLDNANTLLGATASAVLVLGAVFAFFKWIRPAIKGVKSDARKIRDTLVGRDAIVDSITGRELAPAIPSVGERMATVEAAITQLADTTKRMDAIEARQATADERTAAIERHLGLERAIAGAEHVQLLRTMEAAIKADPEPEPEP